MRVCTGVRGCARVSTHTCQPRACMHALVQDIFALARSSAATTKNVPILRLYPLASTPRPYAYDPRLPFPVILVFLDPILNRQQIGIILSQQWVFKFTEIMRILI